MKRKRNSTKRKQQDLSDWSFNEGLARVLIGLLALLIYIKLFIIK